MKPKLLIAMLLFSAGCEILEEDLSRDRVLIVAPADKVSLQAGPVAFRWQAMPYARGYEFRVVSPSFDRAERIVADTVIRADSLGRGYGCTLQLAGGEYQWSVTAFNGGYTSLAEIRTLRVENPASETTGMFGRVAFPETTEASENRISAAVPENPSSRVTVMTR